MATERLVKVGRSRADTSWMDGFSYGAPAKRRRPMPKGVGAAAAALVVLGIAAGLFVVTRGGGEVVVKHTEDTLAQADHGEDRQAQANLQAALVTAKMAFVDAGDYSSSGPAQLAALEPSLTYVDGTRSSTAPNVISVSASATDWAAAALSASGTCVWVHDSLSGGTTYGSGQPCTGQAAMAA